MKVAIGEIDAYRSTYPLLIDGEVWQTVHLSIFGKFPKFPEGSKEELEERFKALEYKGAKNFILRRLAMKNYHSAELIEALSKRQVDMTVIRSLLAEFIGLGYSDDEAWLNSYIRSLRNRRFGFRSIEIKLRGKGIETSEILEAIETVKASEGEEENERHSIDRLLASRYKNRDLSDRKEQQKVIAGLMRKGFSCDDIFAAMKEAKRHIDS